MRDIAVLQAHLALSLVSRDILRGIGLTNDASLATGKSVNDEVQCDFFYSKQETGVDCSANVSSACILT